jgi:ribosomal protein S18 acetylase RimI-like enzyme
LQIEEISNKKIIEQFLRKDTFLNIYSIGDLDDFFYPKTQWFALLSDNQIRAIILIYDDIQFPVLLALNKHKLDVDYDTIRRLTKLIPKKFYAHLTADFKVLLNRFCQSRSYGMLYKMGITNYSHINSIDATEVHQLKREDENDILNLYKISYPNNWFNSRMLDTHQYYGIKKDNKLISIAGVHVYSKEFRVAALGNITTHPDYRNRGLAKIVVSKLCKSLLKNTEHIGLNVHKENLSAINCYKSLGFTITGEYEECMLTLKS